MVIYSIENFEAIIVSICVCTCISWSQLKANALHDIYIYIYISRKNGLHVKKLGKEIFVAIFPHGTIFFFVINSYFVRLSKKIMTVQQSLHVLICLNNSPCFL